MCGRFALGVNAHDLETGTQRDYFARAPTASASSPPSPPADNHHHHDDHQPQQGSSTSTTTTQHPIQWASLESQSAFRPRFNVRPSLHPSLPPRPPPPAHPRSHCTQVAPTTKVPVLRRSQRDPDTFEFDLLRWGLVPQCVPSPPRSPPSLSPSLTCPSLASLARSWYATPPDAGLSTINAQCESVFEATPAWRGPRDTKRCVVVAQGFYEWLTKGKDKVPHFVKRKDGKLMAFGALALDLSCRFLALLRAKR